jgi:senataxin
MHPMISEFPRHIFYEGMLADGPNVQTSNFGDKLISISKNFPHFKPLTILDLDSREEREGTRLSNMHEAQLVLHLYLSLDRKSDGLLAKSRVAVITPYAQQTLVLHRLFNDTFGSSYLDRVEIRLVYCSYHFGM